MPTIERGTGGLDVGPAPQAVRLGDGRDLGSFEARQDRKVVAQRAVAAAQEREAGAFVLNLAAGMRPV